MPPPNPIDTFLLRLRRSLVEETFVTLRLTRPVDPSADVESVDCRLVDLKGGPHLSCTLHEPKRDVTQNHEVEPGLEWISEMLATRYQSAYLGTTERDWQLHRPANGRARIAGHRPRATLVPSRGHDRAKQTVLGADAADWLQALGICNSNGRPKPSMSDKHRQISRYVEILHHLARDCGWVDESIRKTPLSLADMGCGKGYLTFAAWNLLCRTLGRTASVLGIEVREDLVTQANRVAQSIGAGTLEFVAGDIARVPLGRLDGLIALHACDTATDDAIRRGIKLGCQLIVVAPCCHQALRPELGHSDLLAPILRHGLFKERLAEWLTDGLRTLCLEWAGYDVKVIEFVPSEHTPRNVMLAAIRKRPPFSDPAARERIVDLKRNFGVKSHALDDLGT